jgi:hypothetical protein
MKKYMNFLFEKLLFRDIGGTELAQPDKKVRRAKRVALGLITGVFLAGMVLTAAHAFAYYNALKADLFKKPDEIAEPALFAPTAVWFTHETGDPYQIQGILPYFQTFEAGRLTLEIVNVNDIPLEIVSVQDMQGRYKYPFPQPTTLLPSQDYQPQQFVIEGVDGFMLDPLSELVVNYQYDDGVLRQAMVIPFKKMDEDVFGSTTIRTTDNMASFDFIGEDRASIFFNGEKVRIDEPLFIPQGKTLHISAGQQIDLVKQAFIVSRAPVIFEGTELQPVRIFSSDGSGRGLLVLQAQERSILTHTIFDGLDTPRSGFWELTGAVTFYESDVDISNGTFINNASEDGLNIIRSDFTIANSYFSNTASDAFDADFCTGVISGSTFENTVNDAIDVSGSAITVRDTNCRENGDKGISAGENSQVNLQSVFIDQAVVGIASKDLSTVTGDDVNISNTRIALTLYVKKTEFGPAEMTLENLSISGNIDLEYLIQPGSTLVIDGCTILPRSAAKESLLFEKMINGEPIQ